ncbi:hypothetical protein AAG570_008374 [Ranatra chinensis]|uniref:Translocon-associated protein subunit delta n=1 Tax=Ranatra chinensis TaxID=642074 RepID=A0ABD0XSZ0_9HEMI
MSALVRLAVFAVFLNFAASEGCTKPEITSVSYTTQDATIVTNIAFVSEFTFRCSGLPSDVPLYAEVGGSVFPAVHIGREKYQVSWTEEVGKARSGDYKVNVYDEEGYGNLRKAIRGNYEHTSPVEPLSTVIVNHPATYQGPWVNSEFMAAVLAALVWYLAFTAKSKLLL